MIRGLAVVAAASIAALLAAELSLRAFAPIHTVGIRRSYEYDSLLGVRLGSGVDERRLTDHLEEIHTNRMGVVDFREDFSGYPAVAFALGDSYTQGTGLPSDASYPAQLDESLNRDSAGMYVRRIAVLNLGLGSFGGEQSLRALERFGRTIRAPSWCLYLGSDNDYEDDLLFQSGARHRQLVAGTPRWYGLEKPIAWVGDTQLGLRLRLGLSQGRLNRVRKAARSAASTPPTAGERVNAEAKPASPARQRSVAELEWPVIERIVQSCAALGGRAILSWIPHGDRLSYDWLKARAADRGIAFNDWYPRVTSMIDAIPGYPVANPHSGGHYRGWVSRQIAEGFRDEITRSGITPTGTPSPIPTSASR